MTAATELHTMRLVLRSPSIGLCAAIRDFQLRNRAHLQPWEPPTPDNCLEEAQVAARLEQAAAAFETDQAYRYWLCAREKPDRVVGQIGVTQVSRGPFQNAMLGYSLDAEFQGQGLMQEAIHAVLAEMFRPPVALHRIQAAVRPENLRSQRLLERLGFRLEGRSLRYLFIAGAWRDHDIYALLNPNWADDTPAYGERPSAAS